MKVYTLTIEDYNNTANSIKSTLLRAMKREGFITEEQLEKINEEYAVLIRPKGFFGSIWDKLFSEEEVSLLIEVIKRV